MSRVVVFFGLACFVLGACVPNKKIVYLQSENELKQDFPTDTVLRTYDLANYEYRIQPEDILSVRVESLTKEEYNIFTGQQQGIAGGNQANQVLAGYLVDKDGTIQLPEIGRVRVQDFTMHEAESKLTELIDKYLTKPSVKIRLLNYRVSVLGEVNNEGIFTSLNNRVTMAEAIAGTGGFGELADRSQIKVIRQRDGNSQVFYIDMLDENSLINNNFFIHPNDIIVVPPLRQRPFRKYFGQNISLFVSTVSVILLTINLLQ